MSNIGVAEFARHVRALQRTCDDGFVFNWVRDDAGTPVALRGMRHRCGLIDTYTVSAADSATAARYRAGDYTRADGEPVWQASGAVVTVLHELLELPLREQQGNSA